MPHKQLLSELHLQLLRAALIIVCAVFNERTQLTLYVTGSDWRLIISTFPTSSFPDLVNAMLFCGIIRNISPVKKIENENHG